MGEPLKGHVRVQTILVLNGVTVPFVRYFVNTNPLSETGKGETDG